MWRTRSIGPLRPRCRGPDVEDLARLEDVVREVTIRDVATYANASRPTTAAESADNSLRAEPLPLRLAL